MTPKNSAPFRCHDAVPVAPAPALIYQLPMPDAPSEDEVRIELRQRLDRMDDSEYATVHHAEVERRLQLAVRAAEERLPEDPAPPTE